MSLTFKLLSLAIRTAAKPIGNYIKRQAKDHEGFRRFAVAQAQRVHRIDMRMRLGILHDPAAQERMHEREQKAAEEKKRKAETPTVRTEAEQKEHDEQKAKEDADHKQDVEKKSSRVKIKPLSEPRAIELGANFFSEAFIFAVAAGLLVWDSWRSRRKESQRRDDVAERLEQLESEVESLRAQLDPDLETLHDLSERIKAAKEAKKYSWYNPAGWIGTRSAEDTAIMEEEKDEGKPVVEDKIAPVRRSKDGKETKVNLSKVHEAVQEDVKKVDQKLAEKNELEGKASERVDSVAASRKER